MSKKAVFSTEQAVTKTGKGEDERSRKGHCRQFSLPKALEVYELIPHYIWQRELREHNPWISGVITTSVLIGGFAMRYIVIYAGQMAQVIS